MHTCVSLLAINYPEQVQCVRVCVRVQAQDLWPDGGEVSAAASCKCCHLCTWGRVREGLRPGVGAGAGVGASSL